MNNRILNKEFSASKGHDGVIKDVSVITIGEARGHGVFIDKTTLEQVVMSAKEHKDGVQVREDHGSGFGAIVGVLREFRVDGDRVLADLYLLKSHESYARIVEMAETMPSAFGLSISFEGELEEVDGKEYARIAVLNSVDLVTTPAANPSGFFSANSVDSTGIPIMELLQFLVKGPKLVAELEAKLAAKETEKTELQAKVDELNGKLAEFSGLNDKVAGMVKEMEAKETELQAAKAAVTNFEAKVKETAALEAQKITASIGAAPVKAQPVEKTSGEVMSRKDFDALPADKRNVFFQRGGKLVD